MAIVYPDLAMIDQLRVPPTNGERVLLHYLAENLDNDFHLFYEPFLNGSRPDLIILKEDCGAIIIEVKDWDLTHYHIDENNRWLLNKNNHSISSPMEQVFSYKSQLFDLHLPVLGLKSIAEPNKNFFGTIHTYVYFHNANKNSLDNLYDQPRKKNQLKINKINEKRKHNQIPHYEYTKTSEYLEAKKRQINRDQYLSYYPQTLNRLVQTIKNKLKHNPIFSNDIFDDFYRRLLPPDFILTQNIDFPFDKQQKKIIESKSGFSKVKGVAGCGKTTLLAARAINAFLRLQETSKEKFTSQDYFNRSAKILILTYNITLVNFISDKINEAQKGARNLFTILNYHNFFHIQANNLYIDLSHYLERVNNASLPKEEREKIFNQLYKTNIFEGEEIELYDTILIDEVQDFEPDWIKILRDTFLKKDGGEMVLFGDQSQNIYERDEMNKRNSPIVQGFGRWIELKKSYRFSTNSPLIDLFQTFQIQFLMDGYEGNLLLNSDGAVQESLDLNNDILRYIPISEANIVDRAESIFNQIKDFIRAFKIHPNDLVIIASRTDILKKIETLLSQEEETMIMFETESEDLALQEYFLKKPLDSLLSRYEFSQILNDLPQYNTYTQKIRKNQRVKKTFFFQNSGKIKLSTIHSYKGFESKSVFYIMLPDDSPELIYTSITRTKNNLFIFDASHSEFSTFFHQNINNSTSIF